MGNQKAITIRWRTNIATDSKICYGTIAGNLTDSAGDVTQTTEHEVRIKGLRTNTKYYYSVKSIDAVLQESNKNYFRTAPSANNTKKIRIAVFGDCGSNSSSQINVRNAYLKYMGNNTTDLWLLLGDNAYNSVWITNIRPTSLTFTKKAC
jgi:phosphodiesterase/alkaline phosphatase D-like protein